MLVELPPELLHSIFDYLDTRTILRLVRPLCTQLLATVKTYNKFKLDCSSSSIAELRFIASMVQPEDAISLTLADDDEPELSRMNLFFSLFQLDRFTRLESMTLVELNGTPLDQLFQHIITCPMPLTLLCITLCRQTLTETERIIKHLSSTISQSGIQNLHLNILNGVFIMNTTLQPVQNALRHLTMNNCKYHTYHILLGRCTNLRTFVLGNCTLENGDQTTLPSFARTSYPQLTSLTLNKCQLSLNELHSLLSLTPSLVHLKVIIRTLSFANIANGDLWQEFIQTKLLFLRQFEFVFTYNTDPDLYNPAPDSIITSFRTPFWLNDKNWLVVCDYILSPFQVVLHTLPLHVSDSDVVIRFDSLSSADCPRLLTGHWLNHMDGVFTEQVSENVMSLEIVFNVKIGVR